MSEGEAWHSEAMENEQAYTPGQAAALENCRVYPHVRNAGESGSIGVCLYLSAGDPADRAGREGLRGDGGAAEKYMNAGLHMEGTKQRGKIEVLADG